MSTLAKALLETPDELLVSRKTVSPRLLELQLATVRWIKDRLLAPTPRVGLAEDQCAERFIFDDDAPEITARLVSEGQVARNLVFDTCHSPATNFWLEYKVLAVSENNKGMYRAGLMVGPWANSPIEKPRLTVAMATCSDFGARVVGLISFDGVDLKIVPGATYAFVHWFLDSLSSGEGRLSVEAHNEDVTTFIYDLVYSLFLINTPRVGELRSSTIGTPRKKSSRVKPTDVPLTEVKRVVLKIGTAQPRYVNARLSAQHGIQANEDGDHSKRLHRVIGHFRTYAKDREAPLVTFVPPHWRGNAEKGILLHERVVKR